MTKVSVPAEFRGRPAQRFTFLNGRHLNHDVFLRRMERINSGPENARAGVVKPALHFSDAKLLVEGDAFEAAWRYEVAALMVMKSLDTPEAAAIAQGARATTAAAVRRIETARAMTLAGLQVKARAVLWRRNGEPLETECFNEAAAGDEHADMETSGDR